MHHTITDKCIFIISIRNLQQMTLCIFQQNFIFFMINCFIVFDNLDYFLQFVINIFFYNMIQTLFIPANLRGTYFIKINYYFWVKKCGRKI